MNIQNLSKIDNYDMDRGNKHKKNADGRKGRGGNQILSVSSAADRENNAGTRTQAQPSGTPIQTLTQNEAPKKKTVLVFNDQLNVAETVLSLKAVESQWPYQGFDNLAEVLQVADPASKIFAKLSMKRSKASIVVSHGLGPFLKEKLVAALTKAVGFSLATDAASFKHQGIKKHVDLDVVFWDEDLNEVRVEFLDFNAVGHETAAGQVELIQSIPLEIDQRLAPAISACCCIQLVPTTARGAPASRIRSN